MKLFAVLLLAVAALLSAQPRNLEIYWIDCEGGAATLIVTPDGQSLLADSGNPGSGDRDAKRIFEVAKKAGLTKIDFLWSTHYHSDHVGGAPALAKLIPIEHYLDHGDSVEMNESRGAQLFNAYKAVADGKRRTLSVGERIPLKGVELTVVTSDGKVINRSGAINPFCQDAVRKPDDTTENGRSAGFLLTFGRFKFLDLGDLTWDKKWSWRVRESPRYGVAISGHAPRFLRRQFRRTSARMGDQAASRISQQRPAQGSAFGRMGDDSKNRGARRHVAGALGARDGQSAQYDR
jgi:beta-lactamase superfamily II metal-dependent hydrolase